MLRSARPSRSVWVIEKIAWFESTRGPGRDAPRRCWKGLPHAQTFVRTSQLDRVLRSRGPSRSLTVTAFMPVVRIHSGPFAGFCSSAGRAKVTARRATSLFGHYSARAIHARSEPLLHGYRLSIGWPLVRVQPRRRQLACSSVGRAPIPFGASLFGHFARSRDRFARSEPLLHGSRIWIGRRGFESRCSTLCRA